MAAAREPDEKHKKSPTESDDRTTGGVINIGLIGEVGSGRSSFVNAIMRYYEKDLPKISTTYTPQCYPHPGKTPVPIYLWDLPGVGLAKYPDTKTYFENLKLANNYDVFLLFNKERCSINTQRLAVRLEAAKKPFLFIRTCIDVDVQNKKIEDKQFNELKMLDEIKASISDGLETLFSFSGEQIFLISNVQIRDWDFGRLCKKISSPKVLKYMSELCDTSGYSLAAKLSQLRIKEKREHFKTDKETILKYIKENMPMAKRGIKKEGIKFAQNLIEKKLEKEKEIKIRVAVIGRAGVGKSNFMNTIRGIPNDLHDEVDDKKGKKLKVAKTGVTEKTKIVTEYPYPENENITLADFPGVGTLTIPDIKTFCRKFDIEKYDTFIIMSSERFLIQEADLVSKIKSLNKPFFLVRSKIDVDRKSKEDDGMPFGEEELQTIKDNCLKNLNQMECKIDEKKDIFLISNKFIYKTEWDFPRLNMAIMERLPVRKQDCFLFAMLNLSQDVLKRKVDAFRRAVKFVAFFQAIFSVVRRPFTAQEDLRENDFDLVVTKVKSYAEALGFPEEDSDEFRKLSPELQNKVERFYSKNELRSWLTTFNDKRDDDEASGESTDDCDEEFVSHFDVSVKKGSTYQFVHRSLDRVLDDMKTIADEILEVILVRT